MRKEILLWGGEGAAIGFATHMPSPSSSGYRLLHTEQTVEQVQQSMFYRSSKSSLFGQKKALLEGKVCGNNLQETQREGQYEWPLPI